MYNLLMATSIINKIMSLINYLSNGSLRKKLLPEDVYTYYANKKLITWSPKTDKENILYFIIIIFVSLILYSLISIYFPLIVLIISLYFLFIMVYRRSYLKDNPNYKRSMIFSLVAMLVIVSTYFTSESKNIILNLSNLSNLQPLFDPITKTIHQIVNQNYSFSYVDFNTLVPLFYIGKPLIDFQVLTCLVNYARKAYDKKSRLDYKGITNLVLFPYTWSFALMSAFILIMKIIFLLKSALQNLSI